MAQSNLNAGTYDPIRSAELLQRVLGPFRSMKELATLTGISQSRLSRAKNGKNNQPFSAGEVRNLYEARYAVDDTTLYEELLTANGLSFQQEAEAEQRLYNQMLRRSERSMKSAFIAALIEKGAVLSMDKKQASKQVSMLDSSVENFSSLCIQTGDEVSPVWTIYWFPWRRDPSMKIKVYTKQMFDAMYREFLIDAWMPEFCSGSKLSMAFYDREIYEAVIKALGGAKLNHETTAILMDAGSDEVLEECRLSAERRDALSFFAAPKSTD